ncbi:MAG: DUF1080 domain-containing protein [Planctomycetes bacterium]|nr:DUF1080 domain-containing protein [Planctomycetota bacterium]
MDLPPDDDARWGPWQNLFDGKTLDGWRVIEDGAEFLKHGKVAATSGQLVLERGDPATGIVWTRDIPRVDYEISLEAMRKGGTGTMCDLVFPVKATECKLAVGGHDNTDVCFELVDGSHTKIVRKMSFQDGRWYRIRLRVTDRALEAWVDDEQVLDFKPEGHVVALNPIAAPMKPFGLRTWKTGTAIRNLRLRRLKPEQSKPPTAADSVSVTLRSTLADFPDPITSLAFGPEGRKLTCNGSGGGMLAVWDTIEGKQIDSERAGQHSGDHCGRLDARLWIGALASKVTRRYG